MDGRTFLAIHDNATRSTPRSSGGGFSGGGVNLVARDRRRKRHCRRRVSAGYFHVLGIPPFMGREFSADEDRDGGQPAAILSHGLWTRVSTAIAGIVGRAIMLRGEPYTVVGVMPAGFHDGRKADVWTPLPPLDRRGEGGGSNYGMVARGSARASLVVTGERGGRAARRSPRRGEQMSKDATVTCALLPLQQGETADIRQPLLMVWGAVGLVLLIACVNIAGLLLARSGMRTREIATRMALGSGRQAVVRQLLVESAVLAVAGASSVSGSAGWCSTVSRHLAPTSSRSLIRLGSTRES